MTHRPHVGLIKNEAKKCVDLKDFLSLFLKDLGSIDLPHQCIVLGAYKDAIHCLGRRNLLEGSGQ